jgi:hypothetical protein
MAVVARSALLVLTLTLAASALGCGGDADGDSTSTTLAASRVDEARGSYGAIALGADVAEVKRRFGPPVREAHRDGYLAPVGTEADSISLPSKGPSAPDLRPGERSRVLRYPNVAFAATRDAGVYGIFTNDPAARTSRGVGIGDDQSAVRKAYPGIECGTGNEGSEFPAYEFCRTRLANGVRLWFGGNPVASIALSTSFMG